MDEARRLAAAGAGHGTVVVAEAQQAGRGRHGRLWRSEPGNLYMTAILRPPPDPRLAPQLAFVVAVAVAEAAEALSGPGTRIKWPNDIMRGGAKLAGVLLERLDDGAVLAGIGFNVAWMPAGIPYEVTSLRALGCAAPVEAVLGAVRDALGAAWALWREQGLAAVLHRWRAFGPDPGAPMAVRLGDTAVAGRFAGLREDGALLLDTDDGRRVFVAGEVQPCTATPNAATTSPC
jgi:BirA family biotin operon repressor/biotin-[acetyl-CoA-carboxylase] ligase